MIQESLLVVTLEFCVSSLMQLSYGVNSMSAVCLYFHNKSRWKCRKECFDDNI